MELVYYVLNYFSSKKKPANENAYIFSTFFKNKHTGGDALRKQIYIYGTNKNIWLIIPKIRYKSKILLRGNKTR